MGRNLNDILVFYLKFSLGLEECITYTLINIVACYLLVILMQCQNILQTIGNLVKVPADAIRDHIFKIAGN